MNKKIMSLVLSGTLILANGINTASVFADDIKGTYKCGFHNIENCNDTACIQSEYTEFRCLLADKVGYRMEELSNLYYQQPYEHQVTLEKLYNNLCKTYNSFTDISNKFGNYLCYPENFNDNDLKEYKQNLINEYDSFKTAAKEFEDKVFNPIICVCTCEECGMVYYSQEQLDKHMAEHTPKHTTKEEEIKLSIQTEHTNYYEEISNNKMNIISDRLCYFKIV